MKKIFTMSVCYFLVSFAYAQPLTKEEFTQSLGKSFMSIVNGDDKNTIGTFASLDTKDAAATLNVSRVNKNLSVFSLNVKSSVSDGISSLFTNSKLNSDIAVQAKYSSLKTAESALRFYKDPETNQRVMTGYKFGWFNVYYTFTSQAFRLFNPANNTFTDQVKKNNYVSHKFGVEYNFINWATDDPKNMFFSIGINGGVDNNLSDLSKIELTDVTNYSTTAGQRTSTKKYFAYIGDYEKNLWGAELYSDFYRFLFDYGHSAIHIFPKMQVAKNSKPVYSFGFGLLVGLKNKKDNNIINTELYANFIDLTNISGSEKKILERNDIGLKFAFPINFNH
jgi:hypothetical protein